MKKLSLILMFVSPLGLANPPVFSITPVTVPPATIYPGQTVYGSYLVTNTTPYTLTKNGLHFAPEGLTPLGVRQIPGTGSICSDPFTLPGGASCTLNLAITSYGKNFSALTGPEVCNLKNYPAHCSIPAPGLGLNIRSVAFSNPLFLTGGTGSIVFGGAPMFIQSVDEGSTWTLGQIPSGITQGFFSTAGSNEEMTVIAGGSTPAPAHLIYSLDFGATWSSTSISDVSFVSQAACTQQGLGMCLMAGNGAPASTPGIIYQYTANNPNWTEITFPSLNLFAAASCGNDFCVAVGLNQNTSTPLIKQNLHLSSNWVTPTITLPSLPSQGYFTAVDCDGTLCVAVGYDEGNKIPFVVRTTDSGVTWTSSSDLNTYSQIQFETVSCNASSGRCVSSASDVVTGAGSWFESPDQGETWGNSSIPTYQSAYIFLAGAPAAGVSCSETMCVIITYDVNSQVPILYQSLTKGSWSPIIVPSFPAITYMSVASCVGNYCLGAGQDGNGAAILIQTQDTGTTWQLFNLSSITGFPSPYSYFLGSAVMDYTRSALDYFKERAW